MLFGCMTGFTLCVWFCEVTEVFGEGSFTLMLHYYHICSFNIATDSWQAHVFILETTKKDILYTRSCCKVLYTSECTYTLKYVLDFILLFSEIVLFVRLILILWPHFKDLCCTGQGQTMWRICIAKTNNHMTLTWRPMPNSFIHSSYDPGNVPTIQRRKCEPSVSHSHCCLLNPWPTLRTWLSGWGYMSWRANTVWIFVIKEMSLVGNVVLMSFFLLCHFTFSAMTFDLRLSGCHVSV